MCCIRGSFAKSTRISMKEGLMGLECSRMAHIGKKRSFQGMH